MGITRVSALLHVAPWAVAPLTPLVSCYCIWQRVGRPHSIDFTRFAIAACGAVGSGAMLLCVVPFAVAPYTLFEAAAHMAVCWSGMLDEAREC
jgi:hypothetical protein